MARDIIAITPVLDRKLKKLRPRDVPMMIFGGSPHIVALPPKLAQKTSETIIGTGSNDKRSESSSDTAARNRMTVIESMNIESANDMIINTTKIRSGL